MSSFIVSFYLYIVCFFISINADALTSKLSDINIALYAFFWLIFAWHIFIHLYIFKPLV